MLKKLIYKYGIPSLIKTESHEPEKHIGYDPVLKRKLTALVEVERWSVKMLWMVRTRYLMTLIISQPNNSSGETRYQEWFDNISNQSVVQKNLVVGIMGKIYAFREIKSL